MPYNFVRITNYYPQYLADYYLKHPGAKNISYNKQHKQLTDDSFEIVSSYTKNFNSIGIKAFDIISNSIPLQNAWKKENKLPERISQKDIIMHQLSCYNPEVLWIDDFSFLCKEWKADLLKQVPSIKLLIGHICAPFNSLLEEKFKLMDIMFTCTPCFKTQLNKIGIKTYLIYHGFEKSVLDNLNTNNKFSSSDFLFSGSLYTGSGFHKTRIEYIEKIIDAGINVDLYCNLESRKKVALKKATYSMIKGMKKIKVEKLIEKIPLLIKYKSYGETPIRYYSSELIKRVKPPVFGYDMYKLLSKAKIVFNSHGEIAKKCAGNIRLFEATGVGSCLITDWKENISDLFKPEKEIVTYKSPEECIDKVKWLLNNPLEREKIAEAGQKRTLTDHTIENRTRLMNEIIKKELQRL